MLVIPAIDLRAGRCVRLLQGRLEDETVYSDDPVAVARRWAEAGAPRIHVVDLDGAFEGRPAHLDVIKAMVAAVPVPIQVGGGIRDVETAAALLEAGVAYVIFGTVAVEKPQVVAEACRRFPGRVLVGIDGRDGYVAVRGWVQETSRRATDLAREMAELGVAALIVTDISRDGALTGPNVAVLEEVAAAAGIPVIASGGVSSLDDIIALAALEDRGVQGVIVGRALYTGDVDLREAVAAVGGQGSGEADVRGEAQGNGARES